MALWVAQAPGRQFLSVVVIGELTRGVELLHRKDPQQGRALAEWLTALIDDFADGILPVTVQVATTWGRLSARRPLPTSDGLIAATALVHDLTQTDRERSRHRAPDRPNWPSEVDGWSRQPPSKPSQATSVTHPARLVPHQAPGQAMITQLRRHPGTHPCTSSPGRSDADPTKPPPGHATNDEQPRPPTHDHPGARTMITPSVAVVLAIHVVRRSACWPSLRIHASLNQGTVVIIGLRVGWLLPQVL